MKNIFLIIILFFCFSCKKDKNINIDSTPLVVVVKFISAESFADTLEARKYINVNKVYDKYIDSENSTAEKVWMSKVMFMYNLNNDKKFTSHFKFYKYTFKQTIYTNKAIVTFTSKNVNDRIKAIQYLLEINKLKKWEIIDITYKK